MAFRRNMGRITNPTYKEAVTKSDSLLLILHFFPFVAFVYFVSKSLSLKP